MGIPKQRKYYQKHTTISMIKLRIQYDSIETWQWKIHETYEKRNNKQLLDDVKKKQHNYCVTVQTVACQAQKTIFKLSDNHITILASINQQHSTQHAPNPKIQMKHFFDD